MSFDLGEFHDLAGSIENRLGILRGNNLIREWWDDWQAQLGDTPRYGFLPYASEPAEWEYRVEFSYFGMPAIEGTDPDQQAAAETAARAQVEEAARQVWENGRAWADGLAGYLADICASLIRPQESSLTELTNDFTWVRDRLQAAIPTNWAEGGLDLGDWVGASSDHFHDFVDQLADQVDEYAAFVAHAAGWWSSACALVLQTQSGLNAFLREVDQNLHDQLIQWALTQGNPQSTTGEINPKVLDVVALGDSIITLIPPAAKVRDTAKNAYAVVDNALGLFGVEPELTLPAKFTVASAEEIWTGLTTTLHEDYRLTCDDQLEQMAEQSTAALTDIDGQGNAFYPVDVGEGARAPEWTHPQEG